MGRTVTPRLMPTTNPAAVRHAARKAIASIALSLIEPPKIKLSGGATSNVTFLKVEETTPSDRAVTVLIVAAVVTQHVAIRKCAATRATAKGRPGATVIVYVPSATASACGRAVLRENEMIN